jgi:hypothetical protein
MADKVKYKVLATIFVYNDGNTKKTYKRGDTFLTDAGVRLSKRFPGKIAKVGDVKTEKVPEKPNK